MSTANNRLTATGFLLRFLFALLLVIFTYNPSGYSYVDWVINMTDSPLVYKAISGIILAIAWVVYLRATKNSLGPVGTTLAATLFGCLVWLLVEWGLFDLNNVTAVTWIVEVILAAVLAIGMCWSHIRRQLTGQVSTDEVEG